MMNLFIGIGLLDHMVSVCETQKQTRLFLIYYYFIHHILLLVLMLAVSWLWVSASGITSHATVQNRNNMTKTKVFLLVSLFYFKFFWSRIKIILRNIPTNFPLCWVANGFCTNICHSNCKLFKERDESLTWYLKHRVSFKSSITPRVSI